jgi:hypothetical protein
MCARKIITSIPENSDVVKSAFSFGASVGTDMNA